MVPWYPLVGHSVGRSLPARILEPGMRECLERYVAGWWCWDDSPHHKVKLLGRQWGSETEQARPVKTVKVHTPIAKWGMDQTVGSPHGKLWVAP